VHDTRVVNGLEPLGDLTASVDHFLDRQRPVRQTLGQVLARHELHGDEAGIAHPIDAEDLCDVRVI
jgi:hypothetical protein